MRNNTLLEVKDLVVEYTSDENIIQAVNGVSFSLEKGRTLALVGETGAGKTTIAKTILRVLPDRAARIKNGEVNFAGRNLLSYSEREMRKIRGNHISMVFQDPMTALNPIMRLGPQIAEVFQEHNNVSKKEARRKAEEMLSLVGIPPERFENYPHEFSGGMKQRVVIAMALACNPELLLADEPTTALDVTIQAQVIKMIKELRDRYNTALVLITHDLGVVANIADDVAVVYAGEIVEFGSKFDVYLHPKHPYTVALFNAIPNLTVSSKRLMNIKGLPPDPSNLPSGCCFSPRCQYATDECRKTHPEDSVVEGAHRCKCLRWNEIEEEAAI